MGFWCFGNYSGSLGGNGFLIRWLGTPPCMGKVKTDGYKFNNSNSIHYQKKENFMKTVIKKLPFLLVFLIMGATHSLQAQVVYSHTITAPGYAGLKYRYKVSVRTTTENHEKVALGVVIESKEMEGHQHHQAPPDAHKFLPGSAKWKEVVLEGTLPQNYKQINLIVVPIGMGEYFMDDLSFEIQTRDSLWKLIYQAGFEKDMGGWHQGMGKENKGANSLFTGTLSSNDPGSGKQCLLISGKLIVDYSDTGKHDWAIDATYGESCSCESVCPCIGGPGAMPAACIGNNVIAIKSGHYDGVNLEGLKVMMAFSLGNWSKVYIDERATAAQEDALLKLLWKIPILRGYLTQQKGAIQHATIQVIAKDSSFTYSVPNSYAKINYIFLGADSTLSLKDLSPNDILFHNSLGLSEKNVHTGDKYAFEYQKKNGVVSHFKASSEDEYYKNK